MGIRREERGEKRGERREEREERREESKPHMQKNVATQLDHPNRRRDASLLSVNSHGSNHVEIYLPKNK